MTEDSGSSGGGVKLPQFDGEESSYPIWETRFAAYARLKRFEQALRDSVDLPDNQSKHDMMLAKSTSTNDEKFKIKNTRANETAMAQLTMAFQTSYLLTHVKQSKTTEWPHGLAYKIMKSLAVEFEPKDEVSKVELKRDLNRVRMKEKDDPKSLFSQLTEIERKYETDTYSIPPEDLMAVVLEESPSDYVVILTQTLREKKKACTLNDLRDAMQMQYRIATKGKKSSDGKEMGLGSFAGTCYKCGETGHRANECPNKPKTGNGKFGGKNGRNGRFRGKCNNCGWSQSS